MKQKLLELWRSYARSAGTPTSHHGWQYPNSSPHIGKKIWLFWKRKHVAQTLLGSRPTDCLGEFFLHAVRHGGSFIPLSNPTKHHSPHLKDITCWWYKAPLVPLCLRLLWILQHFTANSWYWQLSLKLPVPLQVPTQWPRPVPNQWNALFFSVSSSTLLHGEKLGQAEVYCSNICCIKPSDCRSAQPREPTAWNRSSVEYLRLNTEKIPEFAPKYSRWWSYSRYSLRDKHMLWREEPVNAARKSSRIQN